MAYSFLVIDGDERVLARSVQQVAAAQRGAEVLSASSGEAALELLEARHCEPSLIFVDFNLPDMNAIEFLGAIRQSRWLSHVPVALLSESVEDRNVVSCYRLGACAFLTKPVQGHELREAVRDFARPARPGESTQHAAA